MQEQARLSPVKFQHHAFHKHHKYKHTGHARPRINKEKKTDSSVSELSRYTLGDTTEIGFAWKAVQ